MSDHVDGGQVRFGRAARIADEGPPPPFQGELRPGPEGLERGGIEGRTLVARSADGTDPFAAPPGGARLTG